MKKIFSGFHNTTVQRKKDFSLFLWLAVHLGIPALLGLSLFFAPPLQLSTQIFDLFPQTDMSKIAKADNVLLERNGREAIILFASPVFEKAKNAAVSLYNDFKDADEVENATLLFDSSTIAEIADYFFKHRFVIADKNTIALLETGKADEISMDALVMAYGAFNYFPLDTIDKDPFLLTERGIRSFLSSAMLATGNIGIKDDVLAVQIDEIWHVILKMTLTQNAVSVINIKNNIIRKIYTSAETIKETEPDIEFYYSGAPFHGYESASSAQKEVSLIGAVSLFFVLLLLLIIFRSPIPVVFSILDIVISLIIGMTTTFLVFREIHVFTFIFGTVLIGICIDYSIHFFMQWKANTALKAGYEIRKHLSKSMIMCFLSSVICYSAIIFAPLPIFKQFSVFAIAGLSSSFLTAYCIYPLIKMPKESKRQFKFPQFKFLSGINISIPPKFRMLITAVLAAVFLIILYFNPQGLQFNNDLGSLYTMLPHLEKSEKHTAMVMGHTSAPLYYIVSGSSAEETLQNEEKLIRRIEEEVKKGNVSSYLGASMSTPSIESQKKTYLAMSALLPQAGLQYESLGFPPEYEKLYDDEYSAGNRYCRPENAPSWTGISNLWIGNVDDSYYSCLFLFDIKDKNLFISIADEFDFVYVINMEEMITRDLDSLTKTIVLFFFAAFVIVAVIIFIIYSIKESIRICLGPVLTVLAVIPVLAVLNIPLGFLSITAIILVFGLGIDYMLYMAGRKKSKRQNLTRSAVLLSFLTTILSFGLLSLSSFMPVYIFGVTIAVGLSAAFVFTMLLQGKID